ncbi:MAG: hypothetical protein AAF688_02425 [Bacteroidota bacterium]
MKKVILAIFALSICKVNAQDIKNQSEQINSLPIGKYVQFDVEKNSKGAYNYLDKKGEHELIEVFIEPNFSEHKYFKMKQYNSEKNYIPDNMAFPVTYAQLHYEGNEKLQKQVGFVPRKIREGSTIRVCIVDGIIFNFGLDFVRGKPETYMPRTLFVHEDFAKNFKVSGKKKKKKMSLKERMEKSMMKKIAKSDPEMQSKYNSMQKLEAMDAANLVQDYLKKAVAKQVEVLPKWEKNPDNVKRMQLVEERRELMLTAMKKYNEDLMDTPEWRRIQENNRLANAAAAKNNVTIKNETGRDIYLYAEGSMNGSRLSAGSKGSFSCTTSYYYPFDGNSGTRGGNAGPQAYSANTSCGSVVSVQ